MSRASEAENARNAVPKPKRRMWRYAARGRIYSIRLPAKLVEAIDLWAEGHGLTRSEAIREAVEQLLKRPRSRKAD